MNNIDKIKRYMESDGYSSQVIPEEYLIPADKLDVEHCCLSSTKCHYPQFHGNCAAIRCNERKNSISNTKLLHG